MIDTLKEIEQLAKHSAQAAVEKAVAVLNEVVSSGNDETIMNLASELVQQNMFFCANQLGRIMRENKPKDIRAHHYLATVAMRAGLHEMAVDHLINCLEINPKLPAIRFELANALYMSGNYPLALKQVLSLQGNPANELQVSGLQAACLTKLGQFKEAAKLYQTLSEKHPDNELIVLRYGDALKTIGQSDQAIQAYQRALMINPKSSEAYWNLANLKTYTFSQDEIQSMENLLNQNDVQTGSEIFLNFSLGNAQEAKLSYDSAFRHFDRANQLLKQASNYNPEQVTQTVAKNMQTFSASFYTDARSSCVAHDPIFIVGLPRSGSTLIEQVLSSHSRVDATMELTEISAMARSLNLAQYAGHTLGYPAIVSKLETNELTRLGEEYIKRTRIYRNDADFFIDKSPGNFLHIGLIKAILPNAKIIDARRKPLACGLSIFKQYFAAGFGFANSLEDIGRYYKDYLKLMIYWKKILPGEILTLDYENVIGNFPTSVRAILDYCGLEFEPQCLEFYNSKRAVATVSSEQVRQPIYTDALDNWKHYEDHLTPLKNALTG